MPFTFPASDAFVLRGTVLMPIEIADENPSSERPVEPRPVERPTGGYAHPFLAPEADARIVASPDDDALPFIRSPWEGNGSQVSEWGTADGSEPEYSRGVVVVSGAFAIQHKFYGRFAASLAEAGYSVVTYDYRGVGGSKPRNLDKLDATMTDWALLDMEAAVEWARTHFPTRRLFLVGHSFGGQVAGLLEKTDDVAGMATFSSGSGYWRLQGRGQRWVVRFHVTVTLPVMSRLHGYAPWHMIGPGEDLPKGVALQWSRLCRKRRYLLSDSTLPLDRYETFTAPVVAFSFGDDDWGTSKSVDTMMGAYPNVTRIHVEPGDVGVERIGHAGYFTEPCRPLWKDVIVWLDSIPGREPAPTD
ncbi:MAG TPA: alpha/beta fold hydrolase [Acidimicrobiia bacterium]|nr:alpha/beta fold hydrolase [Acidimicrobiia bacterium]